MSLAHANRKREPEFWDYPWGKTLMDRIGAAVLLLVAAPVCIVIVLAVWLDSDGPVFSRDRRVGRWGEEFELLRFRCTLVPHSSEEGKGAYVGTQPLSRVGRFLRRYSLDDLPKLINVLRGDMSFVGPRPQVSPGAGENGADLRRLMLKPGLTGLWLRSEGTDLDEDEPVDLDRYLHKWSLALDLAILGRAVGSALRGARVP
jgi:lipopolysaccharide/colanic/teichoic acid biosynthesis glycosyltransferase